MDPRTRSRISEFLKYEIPARVEVLQRFLPELGLFGNDAERQNAFRTAKRALPLTVRSTCLAALAAISPGFVFIVILAGLRVPQWMWPYLLWPLGCLAWGPAIVYCLAYRWRRRIRQSLREQLRRLGIPVCEKCGYDLRGSIESARCPECNTPFVPPNLPAGTPAEAPEKGRQGSAESGR